MIPTVSASYKNIQTQSLKVGERDLHTHTDSNGRKDNITK